MKLKKVVAVATISLLGVFSTNTIALANTPSTPAQTVLKTELTPSPAVEETETTEATTRAATDPQKPTTKLLYSTPIGAWSNNFLNYNCYGYAIRYTHGIRPGQLSGGVWNENLSVDATVKLMVNDLRKLGNTVYTQNTKPTSLKDKYWKVIAVRVSPGNDFHVMRMEGSLNKWTHKPGKSQPLQLNSTNPSTATWTNEGKKVTTLYAPNVTYTSPTRYIVYKSLKSPGIQSLDPEVVEVTE
ncbi:MAG: hypothetical protein SPG61_03340 [Arcanobacterium sp.]|nr:hypothetical protein [Arcanobacterium sp.]